MKNTGHIKAFTITAILLIFILQGVWLYYAYKETKAKLYLEINDNFRLAVENELMSRFASHRNLISEDNLDDNGSDAYVLFDSGEHMLSNQSPSENFTVAIQEYLISEKKFIYLDSVNNIFSDLISTKNIHGKFIINRINIQTGEVLESTGEKNSGSLRGAIRSEIVPICMDRSEGVQTLLVLPHRTIFLQMIFIFLLSVLLMMFVAYAMFFQMNSLIKEKQLRQLQSDFAHALTHDMATPLQTIAQVNNLLANEKLYHEPDKRAKYIGIAQQQILNLLALTERILTVVRAEKSALELNLSQVSLNDIIYSLIDRFNVQAKKPVEFTVSFSPDEIRLQADGVLLSNAVSNLMDNAVKYSGNKVKITVRCEQKEGNVFIYIKDNGYGISEKDQAKIFSKFERGKAVTRKEAKGFGLGLSYVKSVMEAHAGTVNLFSKEGKGSEFVLFIPAHINIRMC